MRQHRAAFETKVVWLHKWAKQFSFVRECYSCHVPSVPHGALLVAYVQSETNYRCYFLYPPRNGRIDGIGAWPLTFGRECHPHSIAPRRTAGLLKRNRRVPRSAIIGARKAFGCYRPTRLRKCLRSLRSAIRKLFSAARMVMVYLPSRFGVAGSPTGMDTKHPAPPLDVSQSHSLKDVAPVSCDASTYQHSAKS